MQSPLLVIVVNVRSAQNVGSIFRSADGVGASGVWTCGLSPYPTQPDDPRPPHVADRAAHLLAKTALGAEASIPHRHFESLSDAIMQARHQSYAIIGLEQASTSINLFEYQAKGPTALVVGPEVDGLSPAELALCDAVVEIPMRGSKESLNVAVAAGIALYALTTSS